MKKIYTTASDVPELAKLDYIARRKVIGLARVRFWFSRYNAVPAFISLLVFTILITAAIAAFPSLTRHARGTTLLICALLANLSNQILFLNAVRPELGKLVLEVASHPAPRHVQVSGNPVTALFAAISILPWIVLACLVLWYFSYGK